MNSACSSRDPSLASTTSIGAYSFAGDSRRVAFVSTDPDPEARKKAQELQKEIKELQKEVDECGPGSKGFGGASSLTNALSLPLFEGGTTHNS